MQSQSAACDINKMFSVQNIFLLKVFIILNNFMRFMHILMLNV